MRNFIYIFLLLLVSTAAFGATGIAVIYEVNGQSYEALYGISCRNLEIGS